MSRRPALVTQADLARALRAIEQVQYPGVVEIGRDGTIRIVPIKPAEPPPEPLDDGRPIDL